MAYRSTSATCPVCSLVLTEGEGPGILICGGCQGIFVSAEAMVQLLATAAPDVAVPRQGVLAFPQPHGARRRRCAVCPKLMIAGMLFEVRVDQCRDHGLWFDEGELQAVLLAAIDRFGERSGS